MKFNLNFDIEQEKPKGKNVGKKGKINFYEDWGVYIGHCPFCDELAYEKDHCVFCGAEFEELTEEDIQKEKEENHEIEVSKNGRTLHQVGNSVYEYCNGQFVSHWSCSRPHTKEELEEMLND